MERRRAALAVAAAVAIAGAAIPESGRGEAQALRGITFSEASENFRILAVSGSGTVADPFVVVEEVTDPGDVVLHIDIRAGFGSRLNTFHAVGFAMTKVVINRTDELWDFFNVELEITLGRSSDYYDGLSFAQETGANRPFRSSRFATVEDIVEPNDIIRFSDGFVGPGDVAEFHFAVTHTVAAPNFYLVQHARRPVSQGPADVRLAHLFAEPPAGAVQR